MVSSVKCPGCGLVQMARPACKACGAALGSPAPSPRATSSPGPRTTPDPKSVAKEAEASSPRSPRIATIGPGLLMGGVLVLGALLWLAIHWSRTPTQPTSAQPTSKGTTNGQASPAGNLKALPKAMPRLSEAERRAESEALQALKALQSVTTAGVNYNEYSHRVLDAKIQVDRYIQGDGGDPEVKAEMRVTMAFYVLASDAWNWKIRKIDAGRLSEDPVIELCPQLKRRVDDSRQSEYRGLREEREVAMWGGFPLLWECASERITEIDHALKTRS